MLCDEVDPLHFTQQCCGTDVVLEAKPMEA